MEKTKINPRLERYEFPLPPTLNEIINIARQNRYASAKEKEYWTNYIAVLCRGRYKFPSEVWLEFTWRIKSKRRDPDNIAASAKFPLDSLVKAGILKNDNLTIIQSPVIHWYEKALTDSCVLLIADCPIFKGKPL